MAWELRVGGVNVNRLDKAGESDQQDTQQRERRNASVPARSVCCRDQSNDSTLEIDYHTVHEARHVTSVGTHVGL